MSFPEEIDIDWINRWLDHGDRKKIAQQTGKTRSFVSRVLLKKSKDFTILKIARDMARKNERFWNS